jgi:hypothetical protein
LNPLSGQRGPIVLPLPFPKPALYQVTLTNGAVIRSDIELSSPVIGHAPFGTIVTVTGCIYTEQPKDKCVARFRLAGYGGYISVRLNMKPPMNKSVIQYVGTDTYFNPDQPGRFHLNALQRNLPQNKTQESRQLPPHVRPIVPLSISSVSTLAAGDDNDDTSVLAAVPSNDIQENNISTNHLPAPQPSPPQCTYSVASPITTVGNNNQRYMRYTYSGSPLTSRNGNQSNNNNDNHHNSHDSRCVICLCEERTATMIHGETGHIACCLICARILKARGDVCPVCRLPIDSVIQHFWA